MLLLHFGQGLVSVVSKLNSAVCLQGGTLATSHLLLPFPLCRCWRLRWHCPSERGRLNGWLNWWTLVRRVGVWLVVKSSHTLLLPLLRG